MSLELKDGALFRQQCYINGEWVGADSGDTVEVNNPASDAVLGTIPKMGTDETRRAIEAAEKAVAALEAGPPAPAAVVTSVKLMTPGPVESLRSRKSFGCAVT